MSTFITEPGTRLAGRYRLEDRVSDTAGGTLWKAIDETLARPVAVLTLVSGFPRVYEVVTAARAASRLTDPRLAQVFDVEDSGDRAYAVLEWVSGQSLDDMVASGPLEPVRAAGLAAEAAQALATAHAAGLAHLCLTPRSLRWTPGGIKITGLGVEAALHGVHADDPAVADTQGLGRLLYAALTAHWPVDNGGYPPPTLTGAMPNSPLGSPPMGPAGLGPGLGPPRLADYPGVLPRAPVIDGELCSPRQVCAGVPTAIDTITSLALSGRAGRGQPPITSPAALAEALARVTPRTSPTPPAYPATPGAQATQIPLRAPPDMATMRTVGYMPPVDDRNRMGKALAGIVIILVVAAIGIGGWTMSRNLGGPAHPGRTTPPRASHPAVAMLTPVSAHGFDVYDTTGQDHNENDDQAPAAIDGSAHTAWHTLFYRGNPVFGGLKKGTGLILDMGRQIKLSSLEVRFGPTAGADVQIELGNDNTVAASTMSSFTTVASASGLPGGDYVFHATGSASGRYVLIWFTRLPPEPHAAKNQYEAEIFNVVVRGTS